MGVRLDRDVAPGSSSAARLRRRRAETNFPHKRASRPQDAPLIHSPSAQCRSPSHRKALSESHIRVGVQGEGGGLDRRAYQVRRDTLASRGWTEDGQERAASGTPYFTFIPLHGPLFFRRIALAHTRAFVHLLITGAYAPFLKA